MQSVRLHVVATQVCRCERCVPCSAAVHLWDCTSDRAVSNAAPVPPRWCYRAAGRRAVAAATGQQNQQPPAQQQQQASLARSVRPIPITVITVAKGSSRGAELMAGEWSDKLRRYTQLTELQVGGRVCGPGPTSRESSALLLPLLLLHAAARATKASLSLSAPAAACSPR